MEANCVLCPFTKNSPVIQSVSPCSIIKARDANIIIAINTKKNNNNSDDIEAYNPAAIILISKFYLANLNNLNILVKFKILGNDLLKARRIKSNIYGKIASKSIKLNPVKTNFLTDIFNFEFSPTHDINRNIYSNIKNIKQITSIIINWFL